MAETMYEAPGIGLAATQVDIHQQLIVIDASETRDQLLTLINPVILEQNGLQVCEEGCLSVPGIYDKVARAEHVVVRYLDLDWRGADNRSRWFAGRLPAARNRSSAGTGLCRAPFAAQTVADQEQARQAGENHRVKLIFAGTPDFARPALQAIIAAGHEVVVVLTQPDRASGRGMALASFARQTAGPGDPGSRSCSRRA
jgi:hypothetical protein